PTDNRPLVDGSVPNDPVKYNHGDLPRDPGYFYQETDAARCAAYGFTLTATVTSCRLRLGDMVCYGGGFDDRYTNDQQNSKSIAVPDGLDDDPDVNNPNHHELNFKIVERSNSLQGGRFRLQPYGLDNTDGEHIFPACKRVHLPDVVAVMVDIDSNIARIQFTGPVTFRDGDHFSIRRDDVDVIPTTVDNGCPRGTVNVIHHAQNAVRSGGGSGPVRTASDVAIVEMDNIVCPTDVDDTPSYLRVAPGQVKGYGSVLRITGAMNTEDRNYRIQGARGDPPPRYPPQGEDGMGFVPTRDVEMYDLSPPRIVRAHTVDQDGNGAIDGLFLEFDERVDDATFCGSNVNTCRGPFEGGFLHVLMLPESFHPDGCVTAAPNTNQQSLTCITLAEASGIEPVSCYMASTTDPSQRVPAFRWETDLYGNDRFGVLTWKVANPYGEGPDCVPPAPEYHPEIVRERVAKGLNTMRDTNPLTTSPGVDLPRHPAMTGLRPDLITTAAGEHLFQDMAVRHVLPFSNPLRLNNRNGMDIIRSHDVHELDGAPPVVLKAETKDYRLGASDKENSPPGCRITAPNSLSTPCRDNGDGYLDTYRLTFSERVADASFIAADWTVGGKPVLGASTGNHETDFPNDNILHVHFAPGDKPDTGTLPQLLHTRDMEIGKPVTVRDTRPNDPGFRDLN
ncbi:MAG TPA: hypothetical protein VFH47_02955, partial [Candidatus Thermoplasmatota archaeon]|nr:hypothetical protein [Candidatus Thermoplasmatota archaeon]